MNLHIWTMNNNELEFYNCISSKILFEGHKTFRYICNFIFYLGNNNNI